MRRGCRSIILTAAAAWLVSALAPSAFAQDAAAPGNPPLAHLKAYVEAFNSGVPGQMKAFFEAHFAASALKEVPLQQRLTRFRGAKAQLKSLQIERVVTDEPLHASLLTKSGDGGFLLLNGTVEKTPPYKLLTLMIDMVEDPDEIIAPDPKAGDKELAAAVKAFLEERTRADEFSGVVLIAKDFRVLFHEAYGLADRDAKVPNRKDTKFNLGSINKSFTRVAIHQLVRQGKLSLDDTIKKILPDYPNAQAAEKVTVRHLLNMTSGIGDFFGERYDATPKEKILSLRDYLPLFVDQPLEFEPGTSNRYSNGGYIVLGLIIEKLTGVDYYAYVRENIFKPCGMTDTDAFPREAEDAEPGPGLRPRERSGREPARRQLRDAPGTRQLGRRRLLDGGGYAKIYPGPERREDLPARCRQRAGDRRRGPGHQLRRRVGPAKRLRRHRPDELRPAHGRADGPPDRRLAAPIATRAGS